MICSVHHGPIRGKAFRWNHRPMCKRCYRYFCARVRVIRKPKQQPSRGGALTRLRRWLRW
jgi:hypothetical protein